MLLSVGQYQTSPYIEISNKMNDIYISTWWYHVSFSLHHYFVNIVRKIPITIDKLLMTTDDQIYLLYRHVLSDMLEITSLSHPYISVQSITPNSGDWLTTVPGFVITKGMSHPWGQINVDKVSIWFQWSLPSGKHWWVLSDNECYAA